MVNLLLFYYIFEIFFVFDVLVKIILNYVIWCFIDMYNFFLNNVYSSYKKLKNDFSGVVNGIGLRFEVVLISIKIILL